MTYLTRFTKHMLTTNGLTEIKVPTGSVIVTVERVHCYRPHDGQHAVPGDSGWRDRPFVYVQEPIGKEEHEQETLKVVGVEVHHHTDICERYDRVVFLAAIKDVLYFEVTDHPSERVFGRTFAPTMLRKP